MKQTAVEWYTEQEIKLTLDFLANKINQLDYGIKRVKLIEQAKAMEKEQIEIAFFKGDLFAEDYFDADNPTKDVSENYYKQTYESK